MGRKLVLTAASMFFIAGILLAIHTDSSASSCRDECYSSCCGDEGICNGDDEQSCVTDCLKDCESPDDTIPTVTAPAPSDNGSSSDSGSSDSGNTDDNGNTSTP